MFQTPRTCSAAAVSSTSSHPHLVFFCFAQTKLLEYFFSYKVPGYETFWAFALLRMSLYCPHLWLTVYLGTEFYIQNQGLANYGPWVKSNTALLVHLCTVRSAFVLHCRIESLRKKPPDPQDHLTILPLREKVCLPLFKIVLSQNAEVLLHCFLLMRTLWALHYCPMLMSVCLLGI